MPKIFRYGALLLFFLFSKVQAQLSPGELAQSHAALEGVKNCNACHAADRGISADKCLACHTVLGARIQKGEGIHSRAEFRECQSCHVEHQGRDFQLVWFKEGQEKFDHALTSYPLEGKHSVLKCQSCHQPLYIRDQKKLLDQKKNLQKTFLGLEQSCTSCHLDEHRSQFAAACLSCHTMVGWRPAPGFDHDKTKFVLTGKHSMTPCAKCHETKTDPSPKTGDREFLHFASVPHQFCTDCHQDPHRKRFGNTCERCHGTQSWRLADRSAFDHGRQTRYPLLGKHTALACEACHQPGRPYAGLRFEKCMDCHSDYHRGDFARRPLRGACEECHTVEGFSPARFTLAQHQKTDYPLLGAHLAVPCVACHVPAGPGTEKRARFTFASNRCSNCHANPHGTLKKTFAEKGCELCHSVESWRQVRFDHARTDYPLVGRHAEAACRACHGKTAGNLQIAHLTFAELSQHCNDCHLDVHRAQFLLASSGNRSSAMPCERCHTPTSWLAEKFDHNTQATFKLEGAHLSVPCQDCHKPVLENNVRFVRYKPLSSTCKSCHDEKTGKDLRKKKG